MLAFPSASQADDIPQSAVSLGTPENSAIQKLSVIVIIKHGA